jgi:hypothetical protein
VHGPGGVRAWADTCPFAAFPSHPCLHAHLASVSMTPAARPSLACKSTAPPLACATRRSPARSKTPRRRRRGRRRQSFPGSLPPSPALLSSWTEAWRDRRAAPSIQRQQLRACTLCSCTASSSKTLTPRCHVVLCGVRFAGVYEDSSQGRPAACLWPEAWRLPSQPVSAYVAQSLRPSRFFLPPAWMCACMRACVRACVRACFLF